MFTVNIDVSSLFITYHLDYHQMTDLLKVLGQKYVVEVLLKIHELEKAKFSELKGLAKHPAAISRVLKKLKNEGLIERKVLDDEDRSVEYYITDKGVSIIKIVETLLETETNYS